MVQAVSFLPKPGGIVKRHPGSKLSVISQNWISIFEQASFAHHGTSENVERPEWSSMFSYNDDLIAAAEEIAKDRDIDDVLETLRHLCLDDFAQLLLELPSERLPNLSSLLPRMASEEVQKNWTGDSGTALLALTATFVRLATHNYQRFRGRSIAGGAVLDFGCGYGRIIRLLYYFTSPANIWGVDPMQESIDICQADGVRAHLAVSDYLPTTLPVEHANFDLIYSFSVFTHLSERAATLALTTLRRYIARDGLLVITIRPKEYWDQLHSSGAVGRAFDRTQLIAQHQKHGFAFFPHAREAIDGEVTYGDASLSFEWIKQHATGWSMVGYDRSLIDPLQIHVYLAPK
jgi:SAM-dependent methyltransferase